MPIRGAAKSRQRVLAHRLDGDAVDRRSRRCRAARARPWSSAASICPSPTGRRGRPPRPCDCQTDVAQDMHPGRAVAEAEVDVAQFDRGIRHRAEIPSARERLIWAFAHPRPGSCPGARRGAEPCRRAGRSAPAACRRARRQPDRRLRRCRRARRFPTCSRGAEGQRAATSRSSTPASRATPPPTGWRASTGACRRTPTR